MSQAAILRNLYNLGTIQHDKVIIMERRRKLDDENSVFAFPKFESNTLWERVKGTIEHRRANGLHVGAKPKTTLRKKSMVGRTREFRLKPLLNVWVSPGRQSMGCCGELGMTE